MSADILDNAAELENAEREYLISKARHVKQSKATGYCAYCNERLDDMTRVYCSPECRDDHELEQEAMRRHKGRF